MIRPGIEQDIYRTLLYYEMFDHPLSSGELFVLLPSNSISVDAFHEVLRDLVADGRLRSHRGFYQMPHVEAPLADVRRRKERLARRRLRIARLVGHIIKRFPFVRGVFLSGDLSKGVASPPSDIDFVVVTEPRRLWICRTLLILFKKIFLFNRKKYFCLNYFVTTGHMHVDSENYYTATEIAHLRPLVNIPLYLRYMNANAWIRRYFPNYAMFALSPPSGAARTSALQRLFELPFRGQAADRLDLKIMSWMQDWWKRRYAEYDDETRNTIFRCTPFESRAFAGNFAAKIDSLYTQKLGQYRIG